MPAEAYFIRWHFEYKENVSYAYRDQIEEA